MFMYEDSNLCSSCTAFCVFVFLHPLPFFFVIKITECLFWNRAVCYLSFVFFFLSCFLFAQMSHLKLSSQATRMQNRCGAAVINAVLQMFSPGYEIRANSHNIRIRGTFKKNIHQTFNTFNKKKCMNRFIIKCIWLHNIHLSFFSCTFRAVKRIST